MSLRKSLSPDQKIAIIAAGWALVLGAETLALYLLTPPQPPPTPVTPLTVQPGAAPNSTADEAAPSPAASQSAPAPQERVFTAPGVPSPPIVPAPGAGANSASGAAASGLSAPNANAAPPRIAAAQGASPLAPFGAAPRFGGALPQFPAAPGRVAALGRGAAPVNGQAKAAFEAGAAAMKRGDKEAARAEFARAVRLAPDNLPSRLNLAALYLDLKQPARAIPHLEVVATRDPNNAAARFTLARALLAEKRLDEATPHLRRVVQLAPDEREARVLLARVLFDRKQPAAAYAQWTILARKNPKDIEAQVQAGALAGDVLKKPAEAEKWLRRAVAAAPAEPQPALMLGQLLLQQKDARGAAAVLTQAARARPEAFAIYPALADARSAAGDLKGAASALQSALAKLPSGQTEAQRAQIKSTEGALRLALGRALGQSKQTTQARAQFERAALLLPRDPQPRALAAVAALQLKDEAGAIENLRGALALDPKRVEDRKLLAQVLAQGKKWAQADAQFARYNTDRPGDAEALALWAQVAGQLKNPQKQAQILAKAAAADPKNAGVWAQLAVAQREGGDKKAALASFGALAKLRPKDANVRFEMARLQSALGDYEAAHENWKRVIEARPEVAEGYPALLEAAGRAGQSANARQFLARELAARGENLAAIQGVLAFYERKNSPGQAREFLNDLVARDPKQKAARSALEAFKKTDAKSVESPKAQPTPTLKPMALPETAQERATQLAATAQPTSTAVAKLTARDKPLATVVTTPTLTQAAQESASEPTKIARPVE